jgi:hypothetical protein
MHENRIKSKLRNPENKNRRRNPFCPNCQKLSVVSEFEIRNFETFFGAAFVSVGGDVHRTGGDVSELGFRFSGEKFFG